MTHENEVPGASGFLLTEVAGPRQKRTILIILSISLIAFVLGLPFLRVQLPEVTAFVPAYEGALWIIDVVIAVLLFGQFMELRSWSLLILAAGYVFDAAMVVPHALAFPGVFSPSGLLRGRAADSRLALCLLALGFSAVRSRLRNPCTLRD